MRIQSHKVSISKSSKPQISKLKANAAAVSVSVFGESIKKISQQAAADSSTAVINSLFREK
jgi:hypothetical protein